MNSKSYLRSLDGLYLVIGSGFVATSKSSATALSGDALQQAKTCASNMGLKFTVESDTSWAVVYVRGKDKFTGGQLVKAKLDQAGKNEFDPSKRRFATKAEAITHGKRFDTRRASKNDAVGSGTAGHVGFFVIETSDPVNSYVNPASGLTNSL